jgi:hypothetical protein
MPYIRGRYYMNPVVGDALEAAREAEAALQALEHAAKVARGDTGDEDDSGDGSSGSGSANSSTGGNANAAPGPIHRVEIEATELVPSHAGRAQRGFVARVHRRASHAANAPMRGASSAGNSNAPASARPFAVHSAPETHVFANHNDLTNFLRDQFANDCQK